MKKLVVGLFIFASLTIGIKTHALTLSEALSQIQNLKNEIVQLKSQMKGSVLDSNLPSITSVSVSDIGWNTAALNFTVTSASTISEVGICSKKTNSSESFVCVPVRGLSSYVNAKVGIGGAVLLPTTSYTYYVYAINSYGKTTADPVVFTTIAVPLDVEVYTGPVYGAPRVAIYWDAAEITSTSASNWSYLTSDGYPLVTAQDRGICYGTSPSPTFCINSNTPKTSSGDPFYTKMTGLKPDTLYYYRAYAKNIVGISYSADRTFRTLPGTVTTPVNGLWSTWLNSGGCVNGLQTQVRTCIPPTNGGSDCVGSSTQQISCVAKVDGGWTNWYKRDVCIDGIQVMARDCTNPTPANGGAYCVGSSVQKVSCSTSTNLPNLWSSKVSNVALSFVPTFSTQYPVTFKGSVTNGSSTPTTKTFYSHFEIKNNTGGSVINLSPVAVGILSANSSSEVSSSINISTAGSYSIRLCADQSSSTNTLGVITESDELDNCGEWSKFNIAESVPVINTTNTSGTSLSPSNVSTGQSVEVAGCADGDVFNTITGNRCPKTVINGGWSSWSNVGSCVNGYQQQSRTCTNPAPTNGGEYCVGDATQKVSCVVDPSVSIKVVSPNGGEVYKVGDTMNIKWTGCNAGKNVSLFLTNPNLVSPVTELLIVRDINCSDNSYTYKIPSSIYGYGVSTELNGGTYKLWVNDGMVGGTRGQDVSDNYFTINKTSDTDNGCSAGGVFNTLTGEKCINNTDRDMGCIAGQNYSSTTGKPCSLGLYKDTTSSVSSNEGSINRTLRRGLTGPDVKKLQEFLQISADGVFGRGTAAKVKEWQIKNGLTGDGVFGKMSRTKAGL